ncbi:Uncharacterised protein [Vibrio cholerae]|nr:Uncharacterised protein [Vibrio cholerae]CSI96009.1 Uncharacterised protein [Vibrio cholerae]
MHLSLFELKTYQSLGLESQMRPPDVVRNLAYRLYQPKQRQSQENLKLRQSLNLDFFSNKLRCLAENRHL